MPGVDGWPAVTHASGVVRTKPHEKGAPMSISKAAARWSGTLKEGRGLMKPAHGADVPFSVATRFEGAS